MTLGTMLYMVSGPCQGADQAGAHRAELPEHPGICFTAMLGLRAIPTTVAV